MYETQQTNQKRKKQKYGLLQQKQNVCFIIASHVDFAEDNMDWKSFLIFNLFFILRQGLSTVLPVLELTL